MLKPCFCVFIALLSTLAVRGQDGQAPTPKQPLVLVAPDKSMWKVKTNYKIRTVYQGTEKKARATVITVRKIGKLLEEKMEAGSDVIKSLIVGPIRLSDEGVKDRVKLIPPNDWNYPEYGDTDFDRLRWIEMKHFQGVGEYQGRPVFIFRVQGEDKKLNTYQSQQYEYWKRMGGEKPAFASDSVAMLDVETQLPVYYSDDEVDETYEFLPAPSTPITIPEHFKEKLKRELTYLKNAAQTAAP